MDILYNHTVYICDNKNSRGSKRRIGNLGNCVYIHVYIIPVSSASMNTVAMPFMA